jgi:hypothetical protein
MGAKVKNRATEDFDAAAKKLGHDGPAMRKKMGKLFGRWKVQKEYEEKEKKMEEKRKKKGG